ncbi:(d)CMP kinase [Oenococcus kitaharae]|uniref:Cytidylate kinase n=1 Tax=Oenococcus kitaharae DSM 17330 TaxID=1045004 RepID=G9WH32_9LACO|nr:Cytidylate kinase [Oenococcus kitaharae DSM 17330]OEY83377.1 cytidylate kinase [Oenococcus kitaharae]OEY85176.1 cytidylate kinase [Oenococcus kitaharae]OEY86031.1 cytidylate kinase [Oenococcus kitaharae]
MATKIQIAIDGPAGSGKSTIAKIIASKFNYIYVDTGAMYRAVTLFAKLNQIAFEDEDRIAELVSTIALTFVPADPVQRVILDGRDVTSDIRSEEITNNVSLVSSYAKVREEMTERQRQMSENASVVMDGRDIGTTVLPKAQIKIFLVASVDERARRRFKENQAKGMSTSLDDLKQEIIARDYKDSHRLISPLKKASDAIEIDTSHLSIDQVVEKISQIIKTRA